MQNKNEKKSRYKIEMSSPKSLSPSAFVGDPVGDLRLIKSLCKKVFSLFKTTRSAEDSPQRRWGMTTPFITTGKRETLK